MNDENGTQDSAGQPADGPSAGREGSPDGSAGRSPIGRPRDPAYWPRPREERPWSFWIPSALVAVVLALAAYCLLPTAYFVKAAAPAPANVQPRPTGVIVDTPAITIAGATATTTATPTTSAHEAQIEWNFGTVSGTYSGCAVQAETSYDGTNWLTLGSAASLTVASNTLNAWTVIEQLGTTSVTSSAVSSTAALGFGQLTEFTFSCASYGTAAPVTVSVIYR